MLDHLLYRLIQDEPNPEMSLYMSKGDKIDDGVRKSGGGILNDLICKIYSIGKFVWMRD